MPSIIINKDKDDEAIYLIDEYVILTIGRKKNNAVRMTNESVSGHHAKIENSNYGLMVVDLGSTNGTFVNNKKVTERVLKHLDVIRFGQVETTFFDSPKSKPAPVKKAPAPVQKTPAPVQTITEKPDAAPTNQSFTKPKQTKPKQGATLPIEDEFIDNQPHDISFILKKIKSFFKSETASHKSEFTRYMNEFRDSLLYLVILLSISYTATLLTFIICRTGWSVYMSTPVGEKFMEAFYDRASQIQTVMDMDIFVLSFDLTIAAFLVCMAVAVVFQLLHFIKLFFLPMGIFGKILFWGLPMTALTAYRITMIYDMDSYTQVFLISMPPTLIIFAGCLSSASKLLPQLSEILFMIKKVLLYLYHIIIPNK